MQGQVAAWHPGLVESEVRDAAACPLEGRCSECGLVFEWRLLMRPELLGPSWFVETPRPSRGRRSAMRTLLRLARPDRFWREVRVEQPIVPKRIAWFLFVSLVLVPLAVVVLMRLQFGFMFCARSVARAMQSNADVAKAFVDGAQFSWSATKSTVGLALEIPRIPAWLTVCGAMSFAFAVILLMLPHSRRVSKVRMAMVARVFAYSCAWVGMMFFAACLYEPLCAWVNTRPWTWTEWGYGDIVRRFAPLPQVSGWWSWSASPVWLLACVAWLNTYWWFALRDGLRMNHHRVVFACCAVPAVLIGAITLILDPSDILWSV